jgi:hypothetical protein
MSRLVTLGRAFTNLLTVVACNGVPTRDHPVVETRGCHCFSAIANKSMVTASASSEPTFLLNQWTHPAASHGGSRDGERSYS